MKCIVKIAIVLLLLIFICGAVDGQAQNFSFVTLQGVKNSFASTEENTIPEKFDHSVQPIVTSLSYADMPAAENPVLTWKVVPGAVYYEIEFLEALPENPIDGTWPLRRIFSSREVFTNGYQADLSKIPLSHIFWRVQALDYDGNTIGISSDPQELFIDHSKATLLKPQITTVFNDSDMATPLYPAYSWIPIPGAVAYEVEVLSQSPENPNGVAPSAYRIWSAHATGFDCYDEEPRSIPGSYYWRVRGIDAAGNPVGVFSDCGQFTVDLKKGSYAATLGDSITHGGGAISYSPVDWAYSFQTYLDFPVVNLGKSGDTSESTVERFDRDVLPYHPQYLVILAGTNSLRSQEVTADEVIGDLHVLRDKCVAADIRPIFLTLPPINPTAIMRAFNQETDPAWKVKFASVNRFIRQQPYYIDIEKQLSDSAGKLPAHYAIDGLHPDIEGKKLMARIINENWRKVTQ